MKTFRSNGKLLITGEYVVLDGAKALAIPTIYGQSLIVEKNNTNTIAWKSYNELGEVWFEHEFSFNDFEFVTKQLGKDVVIRLRQIIIEAKHLNPKFLNTHQGYNITTHQDFNRKWGLGTSSTLINNIANWAKVNAYQLLFNTFGGSGYDIACAKNNTPIIYQWNRSYNPVVKNVTFNPSFKEHLYFVYLNQKQDSREGMSSYTLNTYDKDKVALGKPITAITEQIINCETLSEFNSLIVKHENLVSEIIKLEPVKSSLFKDFDGAVKSLGAWGGDFVLATSKTNPVDYFKSKGYETVIPYNEMVIN
ncbi:GYDIA family GHMP kinase [uncultured Winogradskyella sp.]|uniref:GYDIA family GHMP kinase n=1 Tax=uncultured Winogradskyella sp. TaxID=395353 RepID=UPI00261E97A2|nr:GYDIA family GHMP kinase [uncultured Winogradskyella sp.]